MTALNFPANPSDGDEFQGYMYDSTLGVWNRKPATVAYTVSAVPPTNPNDGDVWFNEQEGSSYIYYVDADSGQWIEIGGKVGATGATGPTGETGPAGPAGPQGDPGQGLVAGGTTGQFLAKASNTDYDTEWIDVSIGPEPAKTITSDSIALDFSDGIELEQRAVTGDVTFTASNYTSGAKKTIYLEGDTVQRSLAFPAAWNFITDKPTAIGADKKNILDLNSFGTSESTTVAIWLGQNVFSPVSMSGGVESQILIDGVTYNVHTFTSTAAYTVSDLGQIGTVEYLIVAGGGSGGNRIGGGGGAGGVLFGSDLSLGIGTFTATVGAGGAASSSGSGNDGGNSSFGGLVAIGGGGGGGTDGFAGRSGGSGGGGGRYGNPAAIGGSGTSGQGFSGGSGTLSNASPDRSGGGGGASENGVNGGSGGQGGNGISSNISGNSIIYAGGGGGGSYNISDGGASGGNGGGGRGGYLDINGTPGSANTGGGGGGGSYPNQLTGQAGGSGIIIVRYPITDPN